jgi:murein DD-endopeptidase MepM/ murein hydrolase activator NlpD
MPGCDGGSVIRHLPGGPVANHLSTGFFLAVVIACGLLWHLPEAGAETRKAEDGVRVSAVEKPDHIDLFVVNETRGNVTATLIVSYANLTGELFTAETETYPARTETLAVRLHMADRKSPWRYQSRFHWGWGSLSAAHDHRYPYRLPYRRGSSYRVIQTYGGAFSHFGDYYHSVDFAMPVGTLVLAAREGLVVATKQDSKTAGLSEMDRQAGNYVFIQHPDGTVGEYVHLQYGGTLVEPGQSVERGMPIGRSGNTGYSKGPHLHFGITGPLDGKRRRSFPALFQTGRGLLDRLEEGEVYTAQ